MKGASIEEDHLAVAALFPNTTRTLETYTEALKTLDSQEWAQLEAWWVAAATEAATGAAATEAPGDGRGSGGSGSANWAFRTRLLHRSAGGVLRILLHFATEFLTNDADSVVRSGRIGGQWDLPKLVRAFLNQMEGILAMHPFWAAEALEAARDDNSNGGNDDDDDDEQQQQQQRASSSAIAATSAAPSAAAPHSLRASSSSAVVAALVNSLPRRRLGSAARAVARGGVGLGGDRDEAAGAARAWEATCDELECFLFQKIGAIMLHADAKGGTGRGCKDG